MRRTFVLILINWLTHITLAGFYLAKPPNFPKGINTITTDFDNSLLLFLHNGAYKYNVHLGLRMIEYFTTKSEVYYTLKGKTKICFIHSSQDISIKTKSGYKFYDSKSIKNGDVNFKNTFIMAYFKADSLLLQYLNQKTYGYDLYFFDESKLEYIFLSSSANLKIGEIQMENNSLTNKQLGKINQIIDSNNKNSEALLFKKTKKIVVDYENICWVLSKDGNLERINLNLNQDTDLDVKTLTFSDILSIDDQLKYSPRFGFFVENAINFKTKNHDIHVIGKDTFKVGYEGILHKGQTHLIKSKIYSSLSYNRQLYITTKYGVFIFDKQTFKIKQISSLFSPKMILARNKIFFAANSKLYSIDSNNVTRLQFEWKNHINDFYINETKIYLCDIYGLYVIDKHETILRLLDFININFIRESNGRIYVLQNDHIYRFTFNPNVNYANAPIIESISLDKQNFLLSLSTSINSNYLLYFKTKLVILHENKVILDSIFYDNNIKVRLDYGHYTVKVSTLNGNIESAPIVLKPIEFRGNFFKSLYFKEHQTWILFSFLSLFIVALVANYIKSIRNNKLQLENEYKTFKLLNNQVKPHFLSNSLNAVKATIYLDNKRRALTLIDKVSDFLRYSLNNSTTSSIGHELIGIKNFLDIENFRKNDKIKLIIHANGHENLTIPSNILQPIVENAIIHGIKSDQDLYIEIEIFLFAKHYEIFIRNDGKPYDKDKPKSENSFAMNYISTIVDLYNKSRIKNPFRVYNIEIKNKLYVENHLKIKLRE